MKRTVKVVWFGLGGHSEEGTEETTLTRSGLQEYSLSGYDSPERWAPDAGTDYSGALFIDKRAVLEREPALCIRSPMCRATLGYAEEERCPTPSPMFAEAMLRGGGAFGTLLLAQEAHKSSSSEPGPLDYVSPQKYAAWWKAHGAQLGVFANGRVEWVQT